MCVEDVCRYDKRRLDIFNDDLAIVYEHIQRKTYTIFRNSKSTCIYIRDSIHL